MRLCWASSRDAHSRHYNGGGTAIRRGGRDEHCGAHLGAPVVPSKQVHCHPEARPEAPEVRVHDQVFEGAAPLMHLRRSIFLSSPCPPSCIMVSGIKREQSAQCCAHFMQNSGMLGVHWLQEGRAWVPACLDHIAVLLVLHQPLQHSMAELFKGLRGHCEGLKVLVLQAGVLDLRVQQPLRGRHAPACLEVLAHSQQGHLHMACAHRASAALETRQQQ